MVPRIREDTYITVTVDKRNKETHQLMDFDGYLYTKVYTPSGIHPMRLDVAHKFSHEEHGLLAADFCAWAISRKYEHSDDTFLNIIQGRIERELKYYFH